MLNVAHQYQQATDWHTRMPEDYDMTSGKSSSGWKPTPSCRRSRRSFPAPSTAFGAEPNTQACAVDIALPGVLPVLNREAVVRAIKFGLAVGAEIAPRSVFARKNYFYPDLPKGYQISQFELPVVSGGGLDHSRRRRHEKTRAPDPRPPRRGRRQVAARGFSRHDRHRPQPRRHAAAGNRHRAGHALQRRSGGLRQGAAHAGALDRHLRRQHAGRLVPLRRQRLGAPPRRAARHAPRDQEPQLLPLPAAGHRLRGAVADQRDRGRPQDPAGHRAVRSRIRGETRAMRSKEDAHDYRYFPDPDLLPLEIAPAWIAEVRAGLPELPQRDEGTLRRPTTACPPTTRRC